MLDPVAQLFQHCWGEGGALHKVSLEFTKFYGLRSSHDALHFPTLLEVVTSVCTPLPKRMKQLPTWLDDRP